MQAHNSVTTEAIIAELRETAAVLDAADAVREEAASPPAPELRASAVLPTAAVLPSEDLPPLETAVTEPVPAAHPRVGRVRAYRCWILAGDVLASCAAVLIALVLRFGSASPANLASPDLWFAALLPLGWPAVLARHRVYDLRVVGVGGTEFRSVFRGFRTTALATMLISYLAKAELSRATVLIALPLLAVFSLLARYVARAALRRSCAQRGALHSVLAVGRPASVARLAAQLRAESPCMQVSAACLPGDSEDEGALTDLGIRVEGGLSSLPTALRNSGIGRVAVCASDVDSDQLRSISWQLQDADVELAVLPGLTEVTGRRVHLYPLSGLPLLYVDKPVLRGMRCFVKTVFDRCLAGFALLVTLPLWLTIAVLIRADDNGPVLFRQTRLGKNGKPFTMWKFRTMCVGAHEMVLELADRNEASGGVLFKIKQDPRITRVGRLLRRSSLDELPQLVNVLKGSMSLVGPRPPLPEEVASYPAEVRRRLLVKPGLTGLWQVSGRSDLSWEESVRLDLHYVDNWSLGSDLGVLLRTAGAVVKARGAY